MGVEELRAKIVKLAQVNNSQELEKYK